METSNTANTTEAKFQWRIRLGTILEFPFYLHASCLLWCLVLLQVGVTDAILVISLLVFSITFHEFAHALTCRFLGFGGGTLTVWVFGGYFIPFSQRSLFEMSRRDRLQYALMIFAGPLSNLILAGLFISLAYITSMDMLYVAAKYNLILTALNLLPAGRLDGGVILTYLSSTIINWRKATLLAGILSLAFAVGTFIAIFFDNWLSDYSNWGGFLLVMGISTIRASRKSVGEIRVETQELVSQEIAFVESTKTGYEKLSYLFATGLLGLFLFSVWHLSYHYFLYRDLPGQILYANGSRHEEINLYQMEDMGFPVVKASRPLAYRLYDPFYAPSASKDGNTIVFLCVSSQNSELLNLCVYDHRGNFAKEIFLNESFGAGPLLVSPTGKKIALSSAQRSILVIDIATEKVTQFSVYGSVETWSPDEEYLLITTSTQDYWEQEILRIRLRDGSAINLTNNSQEDRAPTLSQDGKRIYFISAEGYGEWDLYRMNLDGSDLARMDLGYSIYERSRLKISPDGRKILFGCGEASICVANLDGSQAIQIAKGVGPMWSPDGHYIAYLSTNDARGIFVAQPNGEAAFKVKSLDKWGFYVEWLP